MTNIPAESWLGDTHSDANEDIPINVEIVTPLDDDVDYSGANQSSKLLPLGQQPDSKQYSVKTEDTQVRIPISFTVDEVHDIYRQIGALLKLKDNSYNIKYSLRQTNGKRRYITVVPSEDETLLKKQLTMLYRQTKNDDTLTVEQIVTGHRPPRKSEALFRDFAGLKVMSKRAYELLQDHRYIIENFFSSRAFTKHWLGNENALNLLNPGKFVCPLCKKHVALKKFNDLSNVIKHLTKHEVKQTAFADVLKQRHEFLLERDWLSREVGDLDTETHGDMSLSLSGAKLYIPDDASKPFNGRLLLLDETICEKLLCGDESALDGLNLFRSPAPAAPVPTSSGSTSSVDTVDGGGDESD